MSNEIERDMRIFHSTSPSSESSGRTILNSIVAAYPLLGMAVIPEKSFSAIEQTAQRAIKLALEYKKLKMLHI